MSIFEDKKVQGENLPLSAVEDGEKRSSYAANLIVEICRLQKAGQSIHSLSRSVVRSQVLQGLSEPEKEPRKALDDLDLKFIELPKEQRSI